MTWLMPCFHRTACWDKLFSVPHEKELAGEDNELKGESIEYDDLLDNNLAFLQSTLNIF